MLKRLYHPPFVGILAFFTVFALQAIGHTVMVLIEKLFGTPGQNDGWYAPAIGGVKPDMLPNVDNFSIIEPYIYWGAFAMGLVGLLIVYWGVRRNTEVAGTWAGFFGASLIWTGWIEFAIHFYARYLGVKTLCADGTYAFACVANDTATKPEYFLMQASVGFMITIMLFFVFNKESRCNMFRWFHRNFNMKVGEPSRGLTRNFANVVFIETITILWFFYVVLMLLYDETIAGEQHWATNVAFVGFAVWSLFLLQRLVKFSRVTTALRYAIPTAIITWNTVEILGRWGMFTEFWVHPMEYRYEMASIALAVVGFTIVNIKTAAARKNAPAE